MTKKYKQYHNFQKYVPELKNGKEWKLTGEVRKEFDDAGVEVEIPQYGWVETDKHTFDPKALFVKCEEGICWYDLQMPLEAEKENHWLIQYHEESKHVYTWSRTAQYISPSKGDSVVQVPDLDMPAECINEALPFRQRLDHFWLWDDETSSMVRDWPRFNRFRISKFEKLMRNLPALQYAVDTRQATAEEAQEYAYLMEFKLQLARVDITKEVVWPELPGFLQSAYEESLK